MGNEVEHCFMNLMGSTDTALVYDCISMTRTDMDDPNVILRYTFDKKNGCKSFEKLVWAVPGTRQKNSDDNFVWPQICKITATTAQTVEETFELARDIDEDDYYEYDEDYGEGYYNDLL